MMLVDVGGCPLASKLGEDDPNCVFNHHFEGLRKVNECRVEVYPLLNALFLDLSHREDHIDSTAAGSKAAL